MSESANRLGYAPAQGALRLPFSSRINLRMVIFGLVVLGLVGYPIYVLLDETFTGGKRDIGGGYTQVNLKAMSTFRFDDVTGTIEDVPRTWRELDGTKIVTDGEMWSPNYAGNRVNAFELVYSIANCCYTDQPQIQHFVKARVMPGTAVRYYNGRVRVTGTLHVKVTRDETTGRVNGVYHLDVEAVQPLS